MKTRKMTDRIISMVLCVIMLFGLLPAGMFMISAGASSSMERIVDEHTLDQWKQYFGIQADNANDVLLSTEYAGGVWTDKSVFSADNIPSQITDATYNGKPISMNDKGDNFLVSLSAIASNKQIKGYSTIPTDTVLILDLSSSMRYTDDNNGSAVDELVQATNKAITDLLSLNNNNRIAVVIYAGNEAKQFGVDSQGITQVVLPLDRYTTATAGTYLVPKNVGYNANYAIEIAPNVKNSKNATMSANRFEVSTSTYMQDGIYEAMKVLLNAETTVTEGVQMGTKRMPIMVLMTDGEPTLASSDYNGNNNRTDLGAANLNDFNGNTDDYRHRDTIAFVTSLTAAFAKKAIEEHYGNNALMYTLPYGNTVLNRPEALSVLNPVNASNVQKELWDSFLNGEQVPVFRKGNWNNYQYIYTSNSDVDGEKLFAEDRFYVDKYFPARNDDEMLKAFEDIVAEIVIQSKYYPTYVKNDVNHDGYLTFVDKIGSYMEVSKLLGITIGERLFSGAAIASRFPENFSGVTSDILADDMINSVKNRLGITDTTVAIALIQNAYNYKQLYYNSENDFEHYIGWFSDKDGNYVDFWHKNMTDAQYAEAMKKGATHVIRSYVFLGDTDVVNGISDTDMMYMSVRIATNISNPESIVTWRIPASLVPTITYEVDVEVDDNGTITNVLDLGLADSSADSPIRLLYQAELRGDIADWNVKDIVDKEYVNENGYVFYTNKWSDKASDTTLNTYSHFEPSVQNERYYFTEDTPVMVKNGNDYSEYTGSKPAGDGYYREYQVFEKLENGSLRIHYHYNPISAEAMESVKADGNIWVIPKDTVHLYSDDLTSTKDSNVTNTMAYSDHPFVISQESTYYTYSTQGNNGKITVTPATGIRLTKTLADGYTNENDFTFVITGAIENAMVVRLDARGYEASRTPIDENGEVTVSAGETVYIIGLNEEEYRVSEEIPEGADYRVYDVKVNGQSYGDDVADINVTNGNIASVEFTNGLQEYGSLVISKNVTYPQGFAPTAAHDSTVFTIDVTFDGDVDGIIAPEGAVLNGNTFTITLKDGESATFGGIPENTGYEVTERDITNGYTNTNIRYSSNERLIYGNTENQAHVVNSYNPSPVNTNITVNGTKNVIGDWPAGGEFTVKLYQVSDFASGNVYDTGLSATVTADENDYTIDMSTISFDAVGTYNFRVVEDIPERRIPDVAYDRTFGLFSVTVTDTDADGILEIGSVAVYQDTVLGGDGENGYTVTKDFTNVMTKDVVYLEVEKNVVDANDPTVEYTDNLADITFGLFDSMDSEAPVYYVVTDENGYAEFAIPVTKDTLPAEGKVFYLREIAPAVENRVVGMHYYENWFGAVRITWNDADNTAVCEYASVENGVVGEYQIYDPDTTAITHINTYEDSDTIIAELDLSGTKTLNGKTDLGGREFSFSLYETTADFVINGDAIQTVTNNGNDIVFDTIKLDTVGLHYFSVKEDASELGGITSDNKHYHVTVLVEKFTDKDGVTRLRVDQDHVHISIYGTLGTVAPNRLNFNNTYTISGDTSVVIDGEKSLVGRPMISSEFKFNLLQVADADGTEIDNPVTMVVVGLGMGKNRCL